MAGFDPNEHFRERRRRRQRQIRIRRTVAIGILLAAVAGIALGARAVGSGHHSVAHARQLQSSTPRHKRPALPAHVPAPNEVRGVHVTMALASLPGKLQQYLVIPGLNAVELDVKDENGRVGFIPHSVPLAIRTGAAGRYYNVKRVVRLVHSRGIYLIGRVVTFEDPVLSEKRPDLAVHMPDGSVWHTSGGLGWTNPYDRRVWRYDVDIAAAAAKAGFDEIQFDYVRFPSDGDLSLIRYPGPASAGDEMDDSRLRQVRGQRLHPLHVRVSADVFGLSATRDLGIGQLPRRVSRYLDGVYPMTYPSHYNSGEYGISSPDDSPGPRRLALAHRLPPRARGAQDAPAPVAAGLLARPHVHPAGRSGADRSGARTRRPGLPALEPARALHARRARSLNFRSLRYRHDMAMTRTIELRTEIPGPRSREILERKAARRRGPALGVPARRRSRRAGAPR